MWVQVYTIPTGKYKIVGQRMFRDTDVCTHVYMKNVYQKSNKSGRIKELAHGKNSKYNKTNSIIINWDNPKNPAFLTKYYI